MNSFVFICVGGAAEYLLEAFLCISCASASAGGCISKLALSPITFNANFNASKPFNVTSGRGLGMRLKASGVQFHFSILPFPSP